MRDSDTYMAILDEGRIDEARKMILQLGKKRLGTPDASVAITLQGVDDLERLERLLGRLLEVKNWQELLDTP